MAETLYRKYRPQCFADVAEQEHVLRTIQQQLAKNTVAHAYLFSGPRGTGKTTIARLLAKALNCENRKAGESEPCNTCSSCTDFASGRFMSCIEIDAASQTGVDNVRDNIIENARFAPSRGSFKVFILDEVHMLSGSSFNALLKTLEEPPAHAIFILATTELHKIPATIASRCQRFEFHRVPPVVMMPRLKKISEAEGFTIDDDVLAQIARLSEGCLRDAESLLGQVLALGEKNVTLAVASLVLPMTNIAVVTDIVDAVAVNDAQKALKIVGTFVADGGSIKHLIEELLEYVRTVMFAAFGDTTMDAYDTKTVERLRAAGSVFGVSRSQMFLDALLSARTRSSLPAIPQIPLEIAILDVCSPPPDPLLRKEGERSATSLPLTKGESEGVKRAIAAPAARVIPVLPPSRVIEEPATPDAPIRYDFAPIQQMESVVADQPSGLAEAPIFPLEEIVNKWERCIAIIAEDNVALPLVLRGAVPVKVEGSVVTISCAYAFHADALKEAKARTLVEDAIEKVLQQRVTIVSVHVPVKETSDAVTDFVSQLGGSLA
ncbi:MAG: DNA polymerase III subunit gamma/tau [Patescibacteria group bacterium]